MFVQGTRLVDFTVVQERFAKMLPVGSRILDFGCGSGWDSRYSWLVIARISKVSEDEEQPSWSVSVSYSNGEKQQMKGFDIPIRVNELALDLLQYFENDEDADDDEPYIWKNRISLAEHPISGALILWNARRADNLYPIWVCPSIYFKPLSMCFKSHRQTWHTYHGALNLPK